MALFLECFAPETRSYKNRILLMPVDGDSGKSGRYLDIDPRFDVVFVSPGPTSRGNFRFTPDGRALAFVREESGVSNVYLLPLTGAAPTKLTDFKSETILDFGWSADGKQLAVLRLASVNDIILMHETNSSAQ